VRQKELAKERERDGGAFAKEKGEKRGVAGSLGWLGNRHKETAGGW